VGLMRDEAACRFLCPLIDRHTVRRAGHVAKRSNFLVGEKL
jgi:hypothetical protein